MLHWVIWTTSWTNSMTVSIAVMQEGWFILSIVVRRSAQTDALYVHDTPTWNFRATERRWCENQVLYFLTVQYKGINQVRRDIGETCSGYMFKFDPSEDLWWNHGVYGWTRGQWRWSYQFIWSIVTFIVNLLFFICYFLLS
jgi:hypothetical protein